MREEVMKVQGQQLTPEDPGPHSAPLLACWGTMFIGQLEASFLTCHVGNTHLGAKCDKGLSGPGVLGAGEPGGPSPPLSRFP